MNEIRLDRDGLEMSRDAVSVIIQFYKDLGRESNQKPVRRDGVFMWEGEQNDDYYLTKFEAPFLEASETHFKTRSLQWITQTSCEDYLRNVYNALEIE